MNLLNEMIYKQTYFKLMRLDIWKTLDETDHNWVKNMMKKYGSRNWFQDYFTQKFTRKYFDRFNDIVKYHCKNAGRDLSMFKYPIRCLEYSLIIELVVRELLAMYFIPKHKKRLDIEEIIEIQQLQSEITYL